MFKVKGESGRWGRSSCSPYSRTVVLTFAEYWNDQVVPLTNLIKISGIPGFQT
jgi:hypothetical protein